MKTLIATLALSVAAAAPALADSIYSDAGKAKVLQMEEISVSNGNVSGFTGVSVEAPAIDDPRDGGRALVNQDGYNNTVFGFTGIASSNDDVIVLENDPVR